MESKRVRLEGSSPSIDQIGKLSNCEVQYGDESGKRNLLLIEEEYFSDTGGKTAVEGSWFFTHLED